MVAPASPREYYDACRAPSSLTRAEALAVKAIDLESARRTAGNVPGEAKILSTSIPARSSGKAVPGAVGKILAQTGGVMVPAVADRAEPLAPAENMAVAVAVALPD